MKKETKLYMDGLAARRMLFLFNECEANDIKFDLSFQSFLNLLSTKRCQFSGAEIRDAGQVKICMLNPELGYTKGNVMATDKESLSFISNRIHAVMVSDCTQAKNAMKRIVSSF